MLQSHFQAPEDLQLSILGNNFKTLHEFFIFFLVSICQDCEKHTSPNCGDFPNKLDTHLQKDMHSKRP